MKDPDLAHLIEDFGRRIRRMAPFEITEVRDSHPEKEAQAMIRLLGSDRGHGLVVALDERGMDLSSPEFADLLAHHGTVTFLLGGPEGLGEQARQRAERTLRLSAMTLTHEMARLFLIEQIYRGLCIFKNRPYHRG
jgi:23S rRNA (pseudouridine1915-N3)-methyltransferase